MKIDAKGVFKDNQKLFLSMAAVVIMSLLIASATSKNIFNFWSFDGQLGGPLDNITGNGGGSGNSNGTDIPAPVSNGKNNAYTVAPPMIINSNTDYRATIYTNLGSIEVDLFESQSPQTVNNFIFLSRDSFYNGTSFHRVIDDFIIQGGDPKGDGTGTPGYEVVAESSNGLRFEPFVIAMSEGKTSNRSHGSQFFITSRNFNSASLDGVYTIFGEVTSGFNVVDKIESQDVYKGNDQYRPLNPITVSRVEITER